MALVTCEQFEFFTHIITQRVKRGILVLQSIPLKVVGFFWSHFVIICQLVKVSQIFNDIVQVISSYMFLELG
jgi:hypothetical protein